MRYENWRKENHPIAALAGNLTQCLVVDGGRVRFTSLCESFGSEAEGRATPSEICEALALAYVCRQVVPDAGMWRASRVEDFVLAETGRLPS